MLDRITRVDDWDRRFRGIAYDIKDVIGKTGMGIGSAGLPAVPGYDFPSYEVVNHLLPAMPLRTSALRSLGAHLNVFAAESFMDELAANADRDPVEFRLAHLSDPRARAVLEAVVRRSNWAEWTALDSAGHGIGYARYKNSPQIISPGRSNRLEPSPPAVPAGSSLGRWRRSRRG
jgi:Molybdopterin-binding domain of aldehyde dehydrogenase